MIDKILPVLKRIALVVFFPVWAPLSVLVFFALALACWTTGVVVWFGTGKPVMKTADDIWQKWLW